MSSRISKEEVVKHFQKVDPKLEGIIREIDFGEWFEEQTLDTNTLFTALCRTIIGQQLAGKAAQAIFTRFSDFLDKEITPERVLSHADHEFRNLGLSWAKSRSVIDLANKTKNNELHLDKLYFLSNEEVIKELVTVKGIGRWTAEMFLMFKMGRENLFSLGDLGLKNGLKKYLNNPNLTEIEIKEYIAQWEPYKTYGAIAMWHLLDN